MQHGFDSALSLLVNPPRFEAEIGVDFLTRCFSESWKPAMYDWYLKRIFRGEAPDRLVLTDADGGRVLATAGIAYREVRTPDGAIRRVGIMVAACVPPREQGRGRFSRLWYGAVDHSATRDCIALLGFVRADNASCLILRRARAVQIPSSYIVVDHSISESRAVVPHIAEVGYGSWQEYAAGALQVPRSNALAGFHYTDVSSWRSQFVDRPHPVELLRVGDTFRAIIERVDETDRLQWLDAAPEDQAVAVAAIATRARRARRRFFMYSTRSLPESMLRDCGLSARPGFMMAMATRPEHEPVVRSWATLPWWIQSGDRL